MKLSFGKYKGRDLSEVPENYLLWLINPMVRDRKTGEWRVFDISEEMREAARVELEQRRYAEDRLMGKPSDRTDYIIEVEGDLASHLQFAEAFSTLDAALEALAAGLVVKEEDGNTYLDFDPENDRITVWEVLPSGHRKAVWSAWGWHYIPSYYGLEQGKLPGYEQSLYDKACEDSEL